MSSRIKFSAFTSIIVTAIGLISHGNDKKQRKRMFFNDMWNAFTQDRCCARERCVHSIVVCAAVRPPIMQCGPLVPAMACAISFSKSSVNVERYAVVRRDSTADMPGRERRGSTVFYQRGAQFGLRVTVLAASSGGRVERVVMQLSVFARRSLVF
eukprot:IDg15521t1